MMHKRIAIIELDYHAEVLKSTCGIMADTSFEIYILTRDKIALDVHTPSNSKRFKWVIKEKKTAVGRFIKNNKELLDSCDIVLFNTLASHFHFFSRQNFNATTILRIHNANAYLAPGRSFKTLLTPYFIWKDFSHIVRKTLGELDWYFRKRFLNKIDFLAFPDEKILEFALERGLLKHHNASPALPFSSYNAAFKKKNPTGEIMITVPGTIDQRRRDYDLLFDALYNIKNKIDRKVNLTLLGRPKDQYGKRIINKCKRFASDKITIRYFEKRVDFEAFDKILMDSDFLILPLVIDTKYVIYKEEYGYTKISGSINDLIHCGKPALVNKNYPLNERLRPITRQFNNADELGGLIADWVNNQSFKSYREKVDESLEFYKPENLSTYYTETLINLIKKS